MNRVSFLKRLAGLGVGLAVAPALIGSGTEGVVEASAAPVSLTPSAPINYSELELIPIPDGFEQVGPTFELNGRPISCLSRKIRLFTSGEDPAKEIHSEEFREKLVKTLKSDGYTHIHIIYATLTLYHPTEFTPSKGIVVMGRSALSSQSLTA